MKVDPFVRAFFAVIPHAYENTGSTLFNYQGVIIKYWKNQFPSLKYGTIYHPVGFSPLRIITNKYKRNGGKNAIPDKSRNL